MITKINEPKNNVFIFDWDDTLFPTSGDISEINGNISEYYIMLDISLSDFLTKILFYGKLYIVSAASYDWLIHSLSKLPHSQFILRNSNIISSSFCNVGGDKYTVFHDIFNNVKNDNIVNFISFGDSDNERNSLLKLQSLYSNPNSTPNDTFILGNTLDNYYPLVSLDTQFYPKPNIFFKSIKLPPSPGLEGILLNYKNIISHLNNILIYQGNLDSSL